MKKWLYLVASISFILFLLIAFQYESDFFVSFDQKLSQFLKGNTFIGFFHYFGQTGFIIVVSIILLVLLWLKMRNYRGMIFVLLTVAAGNVLNNLMKNLVQRPRPEIEDQLSSFSFPSGHAMLGLLYLFTIVYLMTENEVNSKRKFFLWTGTILLVIFIGLSRIAEARHYGTDVLAGWFLGVTWFAVCVFWYERRARRFDEIKKEVG